MTTPCESKSEIENTKKAVVKLIEGHDEIGETISNFESKMDKIADKLEELINTRSTVHLTHGGVPISMEREDFDKLMYESYNTVNTLNLLIQRQSEESIRREERQNEKFEEISDKFVALEQNIKEIRDYLQPRQETSKVLSKFKLGFKEWIAIIAIVFTILIGILTFVEKYRAVIK